MTALIRIELCLGGLPAGIPYAVAVLDIEVLAVDVGGNVIVTITGDSQELGILIERITAHRVGNQCEITVAAQIVDPGQRSLGCGDHILLVRVIKITEFHAIPPIVVS